MPHLLLPIIYLAFVSLGLPDSLLGAAWPSMYPEFEAPVSYAGVISMIIAAGTVVSSLQSDRLTRRFGTGKVTLASVAMTALALWGFSVSHSFRLLCLWAVPYGLGAGSVDASLNNYVALHYASRHMSWLHCMWGVGASLGPHIMGYVLSGGRSWNLGYRCIALIQIVLTAVLLLSLPLWKSGAVRPDGESGTGRTANAALSLGQILRIPGAKAIMTAFFCYSALEQTTALWASSYLVLHKGTSAETAASYAALFFVGITVGRALSGFLTIRWNDARMVRLGQGVIFLGVLAVLFPGSGQAALAGFLLIGLGCAPVYPCMIHATPEHFGGDKSQAVIGVQMASAYVGTCLMPPLFGLLADLWSAALLPFYLLAILFGMTAAHESLMKKTRKQ